MKKPFKLGVLLLLGLLFLTALSANLNIRNLGQCNESKKVLEKEIYVSEKCGNYYAYEVYSENGKMLVELVDKEVEQYQLSFASKNSKLNKLQFRAAHNKFIIVQEKTSAGQSVTYWVLTITRTYKGYKLQNFAVSSLVDGQDYKFEGDYLLTSVIEYNEETQFLYVSLDSDTDYDVYGIDLTKKSERLITIGWFYYSETKRQKIVGGNYRVLVQQNSDQLWFDTRNLRKDNFDPTIYDKVNASSLTTLPIYQKGSEAYPFFSSYFQYVSLSSDKQKLTTFLYKGYEKTTTIYNEGSIKSTSPIKILSNDQSYFIAVGSSEAYVSVLEWDTKQKEYYTQSFTLTSFFTDKKERIKWLDVLKSVNLIFHYKDRFFMLSEKYFYVLSKTQRYEKKLKHSITSSSDLEKIMFSQVKKYLCALPSK